MLSLRILAALILTSGLAPLAGCTMCASPDTEAYPTYGGIWQRTDRYHGRVGSVFEPAGAKVAPASHSAPLAAPEAVPLGEPTPADDDSDATDTPSGSPPSTDELPDSPAEWPDAEIEL